MLISLPAVWVTALNIAAWLLIQVGLAWSLTKLSPRRFDPRSRFARTAPFEAGGQFYERVFAIRRWKDLLPDGSQVFAGAFPKARLRSVSAAYLTQFMLETWRGEVVHWLAVFSVPVFSVWNPPWGIGVNAVVALALNAPCILAQRYNRARLSRVLSRWPASTSACAPGAVSLVPAADTHPMSDAGV